MWNQKPCARFTIHNFSVLKDEIASPVFVCGGCKWYLQLHPKEDELDDHLTLYLKVANTESLGSGWKRIAKFYFVLLNQSDKEHSKPPIGGQASHVFCAESPFRGLRYNLPLSKSQREGLLENDRLAIELYMDIVEAFDGEGGDLLSDKEKTVDINGFQVFASQITPVRKVFVEHPDLAEDLKVKNKEVKTIYMNVLLKLIETLNKPSQNRSETELSNAHSELSELGEVGFKLDWLKLKLMESNFKLDPLKPKAEEVSLERKKSDDGDGSRLQQLEERLKNLELMELDFKLDFLESKLEEVSVEKKNADVDWSRVQQLEERLKNLELKELDFKLDSLESKLEEVSVEMKKAGADWSRLQQLEESVKNLVMMVSDLKVELEKEKAKSSDDGYLLVDEVA